MTDVPPVRPLPGARESTHDSMRSAPSPPPPGHFSFNRALRPRPLFVAYDDPRLRLIRIERLLNLRQDALVHR